MSTPQLTFGDLAVAYNPENLRETLEKFEKSDTATYKKLADHLKLPTSPFNKKLITPVLLGEIQNEWYKATRGEVPPQPAANQATRVKRYHADITRLSADDGTDKVIGGKTPKAAAGETKERKANVYRLTEAKKEEWGKFKGQKRLIVVAMKALNAIAPDGVGCTVKQISDTVRDTEETTAPSDKNCAFHLNAWGHEGVVEKLGEDGKTWVKAHADAAKTEEPKSEPKSDKPKEDPKKNDGKGKNTGKGNKKK